MKKTYFHAETAENISSKLINLERNPAFKINCSTQLKFKDLYRDKHIIFHATVYILFSDVYTALKASIRLASRPGDGNTARLCSPGRAFCH